MPIITLRRPVVVLCCSLSAIGVARIGHWVVRSFTAGAIDVDIYAAGGNLLLHGKPLYDGPVAHNLPFLYTPFAALLFVPLSFLSETVLHVLSAVSSLAAFVAMTWIALRAFAPAVLSVSKQQTLLVLGAVTGALVFLEPIEQNLMFGQINIVLGLLVLTDVTVMRNKRWCGVLLGVAAAIKLTPLLFIGYLVAARRSRDAVVACAAFAVCTAIGALVAFHASADFWTREAYDTSKVGVAYLTNQSLDGVVSRFWNGPELVPGIIKLVVLLFSAAAFTLVAVAARRNWDRLAICLCGVVALLASPISWSHHWVWTVPVLICAVMGDNTTKPLRIAGLTAYAFFAISPIRFLPKGNDAEYHYNPIQTLAGNSYALVAVAFVIASGIALLRTPRARESSNGGSEI